MSRTGGGEFPIFNALVDTRLSVRIGEPDTAARARISDQINEALRSTLGDLLGDGPFDVETVDRIAPWARDLARGLHWEAVHGQSDNPDSEAIVNELADHTLTPALRHDCAANVSTIWAVTSDRLLDQIHGYQASKRYPSHTLQQRTPWQDAALLGYGLHVALEWLRRDPRVTDAS